MTHRRRLERLEQRFQPGSWRCDYCHEWPAYRLEHGPEYRSLNGPANDYPPAECSNCGYKPDVIAVEYADEWRPA